MIKEINSGAHFCQDGGLAAWFVSAVTLCWTEEELFLAYQRARRLNHLPRLVSQQSSSSSSNASINPHAPCWGRCWFAGFLFRLRALRLNPQAAERERLYTHKKTRGWCAQAKGKHFYNVYFFIIYEGVFFSQRERRHLVLCVRLSLRDKKTTAKSLFLCGAFRDLLHNPSGNLVSNTQGVPIPTTCVFSEHRYTWF